MPYKAHLKAVSGLYIVPVKMFAIIADILFFPRYEYVVHLCYLLICDILKYLLLYVLYVLGTFCSFAINIQELFVPVKPFKEKTQ